MEVDSENSLLGKLAAGGDIDSEAWQTLRTEMIEELEKVARTEFPIPSLPPPVDSRTRLLSPLPSSPLEQSSSQEANKENAPTTAASDPPAAPPPAVQQLEPGELPKQILTMLDGIVAHLKTFESHPPHTIQRLSELVLHPRAHYRALAPYLHAVDRVVHVTSNTSVYPLPPAIPDMASMNINGDGSADPAASVGWANPTNGSAAASAAAASAAADEALGGALLTPIPWLNRPSPESNNSNDSSSGGGSAGGSATGGSGSGAQIHSESTETIEGPNGVGSIETVSVSVNGVPSTGHIARGVTQGELLRQEQRAGVVPVSQLSRGNNNNNGGGSHHDAAARAAQEDDDEEEGEAGEAADGKEEGAAGEEAAAAAAAQEEETPHARGPDEIGAGDIGPQSVSTSFVGEGGLDSHDIDVEAAVGRKHDVDDVGATATTTTTTSSAADGHVAAFSSSGGKSAKEEEQGEEESSTEKGDSPKQDEEEGASGEAAAGTKRGPEGEAEDGLAAKKLKEEAGDDDDEMDTEATG